MYCTLQQLLAAALDGCARGPGGSSGSGVAVGAREAAQAVRVAEESVTQEAEVAAVALAMPCAPLRQGPRC